LQNCTTEQALFCRANFQFATCKIAPHPALFCRAKFQFARAICKIALQSRPYFAGQIFNLPDAPASPTLHLFQDEEQLLKSDAPVTVHVSDQIDLSRVSEACQYFQASLRSTDPSP